MPDVESLVLAWLTIDSDPWLSLGRSLTCSCWRWGERPNSAAVWATRLVSHGVVGWSGVDGLGGRREFENDGLQEKKSMTNTGHESLDQQVRRSVPAVQPWPAWTCTLNEELQALNASGSRKLCAAGPVPRRPCPGSVEEVAGARSNIAITKPPFPGGCSLMRKFPTLHTMIRQS